MRRRSESAVEEAMSDETPAPPATAADTPLAGASVATKVGEDAAAKAVVSGGEGRDEGPGTGFGPQAQASAGLPSFSAPTTVGDATTASVVRPSAAVAAHEGVAAAPGFVAPASYLRAGTSTTTATTTATRGTHKEMSSAASAHAAGKQTERRPLTQVDKDQLDGLVSSPTCKTIRLLDISM